MSKYRLSLFGGVALNDETSGPVEVRSKRALGLLAYLAMHPGESLGREMLAGLFWSRSDDKHAGQSLRQAIAELRRAGIGEEDGPLAITAKTIGLVTERISTDVEQFGRLAVADTIEELQQATALAGRPFLDGLSLNEPEFEAWVEEETRALDAAVLKAMHKLLSLYEAEEAPEAALDTARKIQQLDPLQEIAHRAIMRSLDRLGRRTEAIQHYKTCSEALKAELGVDPAEATVSLYREILESSGGGSKNDTAADERLPTSSSNPASGEHAKPTTIPKFAAAAALTLVAAIVGMILVFAPKYSNMDGRPGDVDSTVLAMPTGLAIAVLPFINLSGDPGQEYFSEGLSADLITALARVRNLRVLALHRTVGLDIVTLDAADAGRDLGVRFVVGGSVQKIADNLRVNVQLIDLEDGSQLWAERYDRDYSDIFSVQDDIVARIAGAITSSYLGAIELGLADDSAAKNPASLDAYDLLLRARHVLWAEFSRESYREAVDALNKALELDPEYARAHRELAWFTLIGWIFRFDDSIGLPAPVIENAIESARLDPYDPESRRAAAYGFYFDNQIDRFHQEAKIALEMSPFDADIIASIAMVYGFLGDWDAGVALARKANALDEYSASGWYHTTLYYDHYLKGEYQAAVDIIVGHPNQNQTETIVKYVMAYGAMGDSERALEYWQRCLEMEPDFSAPNWENILKIWNFREQDIASLMEGIYAAGIL